MNKNTTKHTPGEWRIGNDGNGPTIEGPSGELIAYICTDDKSNVPVDCNGNAKIISQAPAMLEALRLTLATLQRVYVPKGKFSSIQGTLDVANEVLAKAEGKQ